MVEVGLGLDEENPVPSVQCDGATALERDDDQPGMTMQYFASPRELPTCFGRVGEGVTWAGRGVVAG